MTRVSVQRKVSILCVTAFMLASLSIVMLYTLPHVAVRLGSWLAIESQNLPPNTQVDAIIVLGGNTLERMVTGIELYKQNIASRVVLTGHDNSVGFIDTLLARDHALDAGISEQEFVLLNTSSTFEDAEQITTYVHRNDLQRIVIVSDWTHARRALCVINSVIDLSTEVYFVPSQTTYQPSNWWTDEKGINSVFNELAKIGGYTLRYGIPMWGCFPNDPDLLSYPILFSFGFALSYIGVDWVRRNATRLNRIDVPNERSSHSTPTPRGGGLGIVISTLGLWFVSLWILPNQINMPNGIAIGFPLSAIIVAAVGWVDDRRSLSAPLRLVLYLLASIGFIINVGTFSRLDIPLFGELSLIGLIAGVMTLLWIVGFLNIFNFMDGIDGLAGSQALMASLFWLLVFLLEGQAGLALLAGLLASTSLGFLFHNLPPARIFMGDVGSAFLGFALAAMPLMAFVQTGDTRLPIVGMLFVAPFVLDGTLTIIRRALRRENIFQAHRSHLYQRLVIAGKSHRQVTRQYQLLMSLSGVCGIIYYAGSPEEAIGAILVTVVTFALYAMYVSRVYIKTELAFSK